MFMCIGAEPSVGPHSDLCTRVGHRPLAFLRRLAHKHRPDRLPDVHEGRTQIRCCHGNVFVISMMLRWSANI